MNCKSVSKIVLAQRENHPMSRLNELELSKPDDELDESGESFDSRFDKEFGTGTDVFSFDEYLERMRRMAEFK